MIPSLAQVVAAHTFLTRRYRLGGHRNDEVLSRALDEARALATVQDLEPPALFFVLAQRGKALRDSWPLLPDLLAVNQAREIGRPLSFDPAELRTLRLRIASRAVTFEEVCRWFEERMRSRQ